MDEIDEEELRNQLMKALGALELNASSSEDGYGDEEGYYESEDYDQEDVEHMNDEIEKYGLDEDVQEVLAESEEEETVFYSDDVQYEGDDDTDVPDAYDWPDRSALDRLMEILGADEVPVKDENVLVEPKADGDAAGLGDSGSQDTVEDNDIENTSDSIGRAKSLAQEITGEKKKNKKKKKKKKADRNKYPPVEDDAFEDVVQDLGGLENIYDTSTSADDRFRLAMENFRKVRTFTPLSSKILSTFFSHGYMDSNRDFSPVNKDGYEVEMHVDFIYVISSFLSSMAEKRGWYERSYFELAPKIVAGFLKYLLRNQVLPEYETDLRNAVEVAEKAKVESPRCHTFNRFMPDDVSLALSVTFLPSYYVSTDIPPTANAVMSSVGIDSAEEMRLKSTRFLTGTIKRIESFSYNGVQEPEVALVNVGFSVWKTSFAGRAAEDLSGPELNELTVVMTAAAADFLRIGTVLHGTFYTLENGITFARPLQAHPSFFVEIDDE